MPDVWVLSAWAQDESGSKVPVVVTDYPTPLGWSDMTAQPDADIMAGLEQVVVVGRLTDDQLTALQSDARYAVLSDNPTAEQLTIGITDALSSDVAAYVTEQPDDAILRLVEALTYPVWRVGLDVDGGQVYHFEGNLYEVIQSHATQSDWTPDVARSLFKRFYEPSDDPWPWVQPLGAHDAYPIGARVLHSGNTWASEIAANVWEPGSVGAEALWTCEDCVPAEEWPVWVQPYGGSGTYVSGAKVTHKGYHWLNTIPAPTLNVWEPGVYGWVQVEPA